MEPWTVRDRYGNEIYMTSERWEHIISKHHDLIDHLDDVLDTLKKGKRRQERRDPQRYRYRYRCLILPNDNNRITVVVVFSYHEEEDGTTTPNNFVTTAWAEYIPY